VPLTSTVDTFRRPAPREGLMVDALLGVRLETAMPPQKARFPRAARLLRHADFERVYKHGRRHFSASMTVFYWLRVGAESSMQPAKRAGAPSARAQGRSAPQGLRVGFTVGRALGGAVQRNRMKRRLREAVRLSRPPVGVAADVVINPKKSLLAADFAAVQTEVSRAFVIIEQKLGAKPAAEAEPNRAGGRKPESGSRS
jgi:ribonuclease P protein component